MVVAESLKIVMRSARQERAAAKASSADAISPKCLCEIERDACWLTSLAAGYTVSFAMVSLENLKNRDWNELQNAWRAGGRERTAGGDGRGMRQWSYAEMGECVSVSFLFGPGLALVSGCFSRALICQFRRSVVKIRPVPEVDRPEGPSRP